MVNLRTSPRASGKRKAPPNVTQPGPSKRPRRASAAHPVVETSPEPSSTSSSRAPSPLPDQPSSSNVRGKRGPSKTAQRRQEAARRAVEKKGHAARWNTWCEEHRWEKARDPGGYQQKVGSKEVHRADAMVYFRLKPHEIDTLPYAAFENKYNHNSFGRSYNLGNLHTLVSRKFAMLHGLDEELDPRTQEVELLRRGKELFDADTNEREERMRAKGKERKKLVTFVIYIPRQPGFNEPGRLTKPRPFGSWATPVYEDGVCIGQWLNFQFDPEADDFEDFYGGFERFHPTDAEWYWD
ncbi:hypothetical protein L226DRAFT_523459 [Lentinus tigrinus ALCF2SS1-7]|uniref:Uncharacterized protein n=1 Tax=Lentinus tigrinus ALCF2SS1-6 TaxID=1328759 RepID=A0A5C2SED3_9APHY|nr:hypothetical protein L227DRAFT_562583 [Lentinus tigrinus ALCF2SS1-6]RPD74672.1 hypothetical protein L226DRAFT_523459 [Lentinus tigrinus ALCF2SS1-7]